jgi:hypothetical protein
VKDVVPGTQTLKIAFTAGTQGRDPDVRGAARVKGGRRSPVNKGNAEAILAKASGESGTDHAGTNYHNIKGLSHIGFLSDALSLRDDGSQTRDRGQAGRKTLNSQPSLIPAARQRHQAGAGL